MVSAGEKGQAMVIWEKEESWRESADIYAGYYLLRGNSLDREPEQLRQAYTQLSEAEEAFRQQKGDLEIRPVRDQKPE
jgi:hypothetical protein